MDEDTKAALPWERLPEESTRWYQRFLVFLQMGPERKLLSANNQFRESEGRRRNENTSAGWAEAFVKYRWRERALAYDDEKRRLAEEEQVRLRKREHEQLLQQRQEFRLKELEAAEMILLKAKEFLTKPTERVVKEEEVEGDDGVIKHIQILVPDHAAFRTAAAMVKQYSETGRAALDMPVRKTQVDLNALSTADLLALYEQLTATEEEKGE